MESDPLLTTKDTDLDTLVLAEESLIWRRTDAEVVVRDKRTWSYPALNNSGAELFKGWRLVRLGDGRD
jgi:hypothetical protein